MAGNDNNYARLGRTKTARQATNGSGKNSRGNNWVQRWVILF